MNRMSKVYNNILSLDLSEYKTNINYLIDCAILFHNRIIDYCNYYNIYFTGLIEETITKEFKYCDKAYKEYLLYLIDNYINDNIEIKNYHFRFYDYKNSSNSFIFCSMFRNVINELSNKYGY